MAKFKPKLIDSKVVVHPHCFSIFTDGSHRPVGNAAYAYLIFSEKTQHIVKKERAACRDATINMMELEGINKALDYPGMDHVVIYSDSMYAISCLTLWHKTWEKNDWMTPAQQPVKNKELIQEILAKLNNKKSFHFVKVAAHSGDPFNSVVDYEASELTYLMREDPSILDGVYRG